MKDKKKLLFSVIFLFVTSAAFFQFQSDHIQNEVVAIVNDQEILYKDIQRIYSQLDNEDSVQIVLDSLMDEMIVVSNAEELGVQVTDEEIKTIIDKYKTDLPDIYKEGIRIYGKKDFYEGIELQILYDKIYNIVVEDMLRINENQLKEEFYNQKKTEKDFPSEISRDEFFEEYYIDFEEYIFDKWLERKRKSADIKIYKNMEDIK